MDKGKAESSPFANLIQVGMVVKDADKTAERLTALGIGPFAIRTLPPAEGKWFRDKPMNATFKILCTMMGGTELELVQPVEGESPHREFLDTKGEGLQHLCFAVDDVESEVAKLVDKGASVLLRAKRKAGGVAYLDLNAGGLVVELIERTSERKESSMLKDLVQKNRSCRRFYQETRVSLDTLKELVDLARMSASAHNLQPLKYILSNEPEKNAVIFSNIDLGGSKQPEGEKPSAYIIILGDTEITQNFRCDHGIAAQSIVLGAAEKGLGGCIIANIKRAGLQQALAIPSKYEIMLVIALGEPRDTSIIEPMGADGKTFPWRDDNGARHVPKRSLEEIIL